MRVRGRISKLTFVDCNNTFTLSDQRSNLHVLRAQVWSRAGNLKCTRGTSSPDGLKASTAQNRTTKKMPAMSTRDQASLPALPLSRLTTPAGDWREAVKLLWHCRLLILLRGRAYSGSLRERARYHAESVLSAIEIRILPFLKI